VHHRTSRTAPTGAILPFPAFNPTSETPGQCSLDRFFDALGHDHHNDHLQAPRTSRPHFGKREFGRLAPVLAATPASQDMQSRVLRWRERDTAQREDLPLHVHADQSADNRRLLFAVTVTAATLVAWIAVGLATAWLKGAL
jgi:hypothetical protein